MGGGMLESDLAWYLADEYRDRLSGEERNRVFVHMGAGDFPEAIRCLLDTCARQRILLSAEAIAHLTEWLEVYDRDDGFRDAVARVIE